MSKHKPSLSLHSLGTVPHTGLWEMPTLMSSLRSRCSKQMRKKNILKKGDCVFKILTTDSCFLICFTSKDKTRNLLKRCQYKTSASHKLQTKCEKFSAQVPSNGRLTPPNLSTSIHSHVKLNTSSVCFAVDFGVWTSGYLQLWSFILFFYISPPSSLLCVALSVAPSGMWRLHS